jgi:hypothetical protein
VEKGRTISGRVLDASGAPVADADVAAGLLLTGGGSELNIPDEGFGVKETRTDAEGRFVLAGFAPKAITVVAGKKGVGRAPSLQVPRGPSSAEVDLVLQPTGELRGKITRNGTPLAEAVIIANPVGANKSNFFVITGADGSYAFELLTAGDYFVSVVLGGGGGKPKDVYARVVKVVAKQTVELPIDVVEGTASLKVAVSADGKPVPAATVMVFGARVDAATMDALRDGTAAGELMDLNRTIPFFMRMTMAGVAAQIGGLSPGEHTACATPLPFDPNDALAQENLRESAESLPMKCVPVVIQAGEQTVEIVVPVEWTVPAKK